MSDAVDVEVFDDYNFLMRKVVATIGCVLWKGSGDRRQEICVVRQEKSTNEPEFGFVFQ